jgi:hypothetical protein
VGALLEAIRAATTPLAIGTPLFSLGLILQLSFALQGVAKEEGERNSSLTLRANIGLFFCRVLAVRVWE